MYLESQKVHYLRMRSLLLLATTFSTVAGQSNSNFLYFLTQMVQTNNPNLIANSQPLNLQQLLLNQQSSGLTSYPKCPVNVPMCYRTPCGQHNENSEGDCIKEPSCCFDNDLLAYRRIYGSSYMAGVPLCYHGVTSLSYLNLARQRAPWSPQQQIALVSIFKRASNNSAYNNFNNKCSFTTLLNNPMFNGPTCGWKDITKFECSMRECCYHDNSRTCHYPKNYLQKLGRALPYPELVARTTEEEKCPKPTAFSPGLFNRLPCLQSTSAPTGNNAAQCAMNGCCVHLNTAVPSQSVLPLAFVQPSSTNSSSPVERELQALLSGYIPGVRSGIPLNPILSQLLSSTGNNAITNPTQTPVTSCPYSFVPSPGLPDLSESVRGCCERSWCFHRKKMISLNPAFFSSLRLPTTNPYNSARTQPPSYWTSTTSSYPTAPPVTTTTHSNGPSNLPSSSQNTISYNSKWQEWSGWSTCSQSCSIGWRSRTRACVFDSSSGSRAPDQLCPGEPKGFRTCNMGQCPSVRSAASVGRSWAGWEAWGACSSRCGTGRRKRQRTCYLDQTPLDAFLCGGDDTSEELCGDGSSCATWGAWTKYGPCRADCGSTGTQIYTRVCMDGNQAVNPSKCDGQSVLTQTCVQGACITLTEWGNWESCSVSCGIGVQIRQRLCFQNGMKVDQSVCNGTFIDSQPCKRGLCQGIAPMSWAVWNDWTRWGECSVTCGRGQRTRERKCLYKGRRNVPLNALVCEHISKNGKAKQISACNVGTCPHVGSYYQWSSWTSHSECSVTCGNGTLERTRKCIMPFGTASADRCIGPNFDIQSCSLSSSCDVWTQLSGWSKCNATCGTGTRVRMRCKMLDGVNCIENTMVVDRKPCVVSTACP